MSYPWHMAFSGILVDHKTLHLNSGLPCILFPSSITHFGFSSQSPWSIIGSPSLCTISVVIQFAMTTWNRQGGDLLENYPPPIWATPKDQCLPQVDSGGNCNLPVCFGLPRGALSEHWRRTTSLAHSELSKWLSMSRETAHYILVFLELQICFCLLSLCMASGSLIFFTFDINLTYLVCNGQEELFRYLLPNKNKHRQHERPIDINDNVPRGKSTL